MSDKPTDRRWSRLVTLERVPRGWGDAGPLMRLLYESDGRRAAVLRVKPLVDRARFVELAVQSQLLTEALVQKALDELAEDDPEAAASSEPLTLASRLVDKRLLSAWQAEKLLLGKYKGFTLSNYRITELLDSGALSSIYRAEHQMMRRPVAIQVLSDRFARHRETRELFFQRARAVARLDHKNLVHVFDMGEQKSLAYVVMEFVPGHDLERLVRRVGPLPLDLCASVSLQVCRGMIMVHAAHQTLAGLHPSDVVLDTSGVAHLLSLRLTATLAHHPSIRASLGEAAVPRDYFADHPDLQELPDTQRDVLSVGLLLCFLLLGEIPDPAAWRTQNMEQTITQTRPDDAASLAQLAALMLSPADSPTSILEFAKLLERWLADNQA